MTEDENLRLRIRVHLVRLMDEQSADAILESMQPYPWTEIATKADLGALETRLLQRFDQVDARLDQIDRHSVQVDARLDQIDHHSVQTDARLDQIDHHSVQTGARLDQIDARLDQIDGKITAVDIQLTVIDDNFTLVNERLGTMTERVGNSGDKIDGLLDAMHNEMIGLEGKLSLRFMEATRLIVISVVLLFVGVLGMATALIATM